MDKEELTTNFLEYWEKNNKDRFFDTYDVKYYLRKFCVENYGFMPDFRSKEYQDIWQNVKSRIFDK